MAILKLIYFLFKAIFFKKIIYTLSFIKESNGNWYADIPGWPKKFHANTQMVFGADKFLDFLDSEDSNKVTLQISKKPLLGFRELTLLKKVWYNGAFYDVCSMDFLDEVYICPVTLFFLGEYPKKLYIKQL